MCAQSKVFVTSHAKRLIVGAICSSSGGTAR